MKGSVDKVLSKVNKGSGWIAWLHSAKPVAVNVCTIPSFYQLFEWGWGLWLRAAKLSDNPTATRISFRRDNSDEAIETLGWSDLETIRKRNRWDLKCLNNLVLEYHKEYLIKNNPFHSNNTRTNDNIMCAGQSLAWERKKFNILIGLSINLSIWLSNYLSIDFSINLSI